MNGEETRERNVRLARARIARLIFPISITRGDHKFRVDHPRRPTREVLSVLTPWKKDNERSRV